MLLAAPWRRSVLSIMASNGLGQVRVRQQLPTPALYALWLPSCSRTIWKKPAKAKVSEPGQVAKTWLSRLWIAVGFTSKKTPVFEISQVESSQIKPDKASSPPLSAEQEALVSLAVKGHNIFYTGSAGSGKSFVLKEIRRRLILMGKTPHVLAPTGKVAIANGGTTTWSFAAWTPSSHKMGLFEMTNPARNPALFKRLSKVEIIIIDEISMMENVHFERLNELMKAARSKPGEPPCTLPFGGVQIIVTGDFCQLPPVKPFQHCFQCGSDLKPDKREGTYTCLNQECDVSFYHETDKWAFKSNAWEECNFRYENLNSIYRQKDPEFIKLLQKCRLGLAFNDADISLLTSGGDAMKGHGVRLFPRREEVRKLNDSEFRRLKAPRQTYKGVDVFLWNQRKHPQLGSKGEKVADGSLKALKDHRLDVEARLKKGMQVVLLHNIGLADGLCNGAQGVIVGFEPFGQGLSDFSIYNEDLPIYWPKYDVTEASLQEFLKKCKKSEGWPVVKFHNGITKTIYPVCQSLLLGDSRPYSLIGRIQVPLDAAWALTVHKSQGMTLDYVVVNLEQVFEEGQIYVALSRARSLAGLKVEGSMTPLRRLRGNPEVRQWLKEKFGQDVGTDE